MKDRQTLNKKLRRHLKFIYIFSPPFEFAPNRSLRMFLILFFPRLVYGWVLFCVRRLYKVFKLKHAFDSAAFRTPSFFLALLFLISPTFLDVRARLFFESFFSSSLAGSFVSSLESCGWTDSQSILSSPPGGFFPRVVLHALVVKLPETYFSVSPIVERLGFLGRLFYPVPLIRFERTFLALIFVFVFVSELILPPTTFSC